MKPEKRRKKGQKRKWKLENEPKQKRKYGEVKQPMDGIYAEEREIEEQPMVG